MFYVRGVTIIVEVPLLLRYMLSPAKDAVNVKVVSFSHFMVELKNGKKLIEAWPELSVVGVLNPRPILGVTLQVMVFPSTALSFETSVAVKVTILSADHTGAEVTVSWVGKGCSSAGCPFITKYAPVTTKMTRTISTAINIFLIFVVSPVIASLSSLYSSGCSLLS